VGTFQKDTGKYVRVLLSKYQVMAMFLLGAIAEEFVVE
jgi:hypothetical protein